MQYYIFSTNAVSQLKNETVSQDHILTHISRLCGSSNIPHLMTYYQKCLLCDMRYYIQDPPMHTHYAFTISSSNILLDENYNAKVSDFGFCVQLNTSSNKTIFTAIPGEGMPGTRGYIAPECCDGKFSMKSDVYSYGIVRYYSQCPQFTKLQRNSNETH